MQEEKKEVAGWLVFVGVAGLITATVCGYFGLAAKKTLGVANANADRQIFIQSQPYIQGKIQDLAKYHHEYITSDEVGKKSIASVIRHDFADFDAKNISDPDLRDFLISCLNQ